jgi:hypothetical protein
MVLYKCDRCYNEYTRKSTYTDHLKRKYPCKQISNIINDNPIKTDINNQNIILDITIENKITSICCKFCNFIFKRKDYLKKHLDQSCKVKKEKEKTENNFIKKIEELEEKNKKMEEEINKLKSKKTKNVQPNIIINNINNDENF